MQQRMEAIERGEAVGTAPAAGSASGFSIALQAVRLALARVARRFFLPYQSPSKAR